MPYAYLGSCHLGSSRAAATIAATVLDAAGVALPVQPTRAVVPLGGGVFGVSIPDMPSGHAGWVVLKEGAQVLDALPVSAPEVETAAIVWAGAPAAVPATLVPSGLDAIATTLGGLPSNFRERLIWLFCRHDDTTKVKLSDTQSVIRVNNLEGTPVTEQDVTTSDTQVTISNVRSPA